MPIDESTYNLSRSKNHYELLGWDLMGPFPTSINGNKYILVMIEYLTHWCEGVALPDATTNSMAQALLHKVIFPHGCPQQLLSDQGSEFRNEVLQVLSHSLGIKQVFTSPYHPETNGLKSFMNNTIKLIISTYMDLLHESWDQILPFVVHAYNTLIQTSTRIILFLALYNCDPHLPRYIYNIKM